MAEQSPLAKMIAGGIALNKLLGFEVVRMEPGEVAISVGAPPLHRNHVGTLHAAVLFGVAEAASGATLLPALAPAMGRIYPVVKGARIDYLAAARGPVVATGRLDPREIEAATEKALAGEKIDLDIPVSVTDESGREVARCTFNWAVRPAR